MRSLASKNLSIFVVALALTGCLVSEEPILDASNGKAKPIDPGNYMSCPIGDDAGEGDCEPLKVTHDATGLYLFAGDDEEPMEFRFRKIARNAYAAQVKEDDDGYMYYYARGDSDAFQLTLMMCKALPDKTRTRLIARGSLTPDDGEFESCNVNDFHGLKKAAKAYHRGVEDDEPLASLITPAPGDAPQQ